MEDINKPQLEPDFKQLKVNFTIIDEASYVRDGVFHNIINTQKKIKLNMAETKYRHYDDLIEVAPGIYQSVEDYESNMAFDGARDEENIDDLTK